MLINKEINYETYFLATSSISEFYLCVLVYGFYNTYERIFMAESLAFFILFFAWLGLIYTIFESPYFSYI